MPRAAFHLKFELGVVFVSHMKSDNTRLFFCQKPGANFSRKGVLTIVKFDFGDIAKTLELLSDPFLSFFVGRDAVHEDGSAEGKLLRFWGLEVLAPNQKFPGLLLPNHKVPR